MCQIDSRIGWLPLSYLRRGSFDKYDDVLGFLSSKLVNGVCVWGGGGGCRLENAQVHTSIFGSVWGGGSLD